MSRPGAGAAIAVRTGLELRPIRAEELRDYTVALRRAFGGQLPTEDELKAGREILELDRTLAFFDGDSLVSTAGIFSYEMTVPGGELVPCGGVTRVTVSSTHRRRGLLRAMMRRQLDDMHDRSEPLAVLYASETPIYGRFGYGLSTYETNLEIDRARAAFINPVAESGRIALIDIPAAVPAFSRVWDDARRKEPGMLALDERWWRALLADPESSRHGSSPQYRAIYEADGRPTGFALYRIKMDWDAGGPRGTLSVESLIASTPTAYGAVWRYVLDVDLIAKVTATRRSIEEPLRFLLVDSRQPRTSVEDGVWLRLVDVQRALAARRYAVDDRIVLRVRDEFCSWNEGTYEVDGGPKAAQCQRCDLNPDLEINVSDLAAAYLGGNRFQVLHEAGRVNELRPGAIGRADAMFAADRAPWCPSFF
ncbi:MAG TPA: GNAT family N-acetyltransferase [Candidatus Dormibacteraeota bacterium]|nr:GNAT family N-acetyltransferase [Candidatus Dormibacteraeota bacterium]